MNEIKHFFATLFILRLYCVVGIQTKYCFSNSKELFHRCGYIAN